MAWVVIPNSVFEAGKPARALDMRNLRDNIEAAMGGHTGAPPLHLPSLDPLIVGSTIRCRRDATQAISSGSFFNVATIGITQPGTIRMSLEHRRVTGISEARFLRRRAGSATSSGTYSNSTTSFVSETANITVLAGDVIEVECRHVGGSAEIRNIRLSTDPDCSIFPCDNFGYWENLV